MTTTFVLHRVADYDARRRVYDGVGELQRAGGVTPTWSTAPRATRTTCS